MYRIEYPRPDFVREEWLCLNGTWSFCFEDKALQNIEVPFVFQSNMSGIGDNRMCDHVTYSRKFSVPEKWKGSHIMLWFGAVDYECKVFVNEKFVGCHQGGSARFGFEIENSLNWSEESLRVEVYDPCEEQGIPRGKQYWREKSESIWYTRSTGIWQTVWIEPVSKTSINDLRFTPDIDTGMVEIEYELAGDVSDSLICFDIMMDDELVCSSQIKVMGHKGKVTADVFQNNIFRGMTHHSGWCWSPENPKLFSVDMSLVKEDLVLDHVNTYFGMRKIETRNGKTYLNNRPYIQKLVLDQGYWPESLMTAPTDEAFKQDILAAKAFGFNGCRKHQKAEDPRFLYWADKLGFLVWSEIPSCISFDVKSAIKTASEWIEIVTRDYNHPSIVAWVPLNESWGVPNIFLDKKQQNHSLALYHMLHAYDGTRLVINNDGWELTTSDICAIHCYGHGAENEFEKIQKFSKSFDCLENILELTPAGRNIYSEGYGYRGEPIMVTECGGVSFYSEADNDSWGYTDAVDEKDFIETYKRIVNVFISSPILYGFCYTQLTDVEQEQNGLLTANREHKVKAELIKDINDQYTQ